MIFSTKGIVLHRLQYGDTSLIVTIYTEKFGMQTYMIKGVRGKKSNKKSNLFFPFSLLDLEVYHRENKNMQSLKEARITEPLNGILFDTQKSVTALFLSEVIRKTIHEEEANGKLFHFLYNSIQYFNLSTQNNDIFHLFFLCKFTRFLGFFPQLDYNKQQPFFDLDNGSFIPVKHAHCLSENISEQLYRLFKTSSADFPDMATNSLQSNELLNGILNFYAMQIQGFNRLKTLSVIREMMN